MTPVHILELRSALGSGGGPEKTILSGAALTNANEFQVTVCYIRDARDIHFDLGRRAAELNVDYVEIVERHSFDWGVWPQLVHLCRSRHIEIVHAHEYKSDLLTFLLGRRLNVIPLATVHGWTGHSWRERHVYYPVDKRVLARFPRLIAVSGEIREELVRTGTDPERVAVVLNGIDADQFRRVPAMRDEVRRGLGLEPDEFVIGSVGRLEPQKRFDLLIEAVGALHTRWPTVRLLIAGEGSMRTLLQRQIDSAGLENICRLLGHRPDVVQLHHAFDLYVQSSDYEGTPNAVLEAMALETPAVATDAGGTAELIRSGIDGFIVPVGSAAALAQAIDAVLTDPVRARTAAISARQRVEHELSFGARMQRVEAIYRELTVTQIARTARHA